MVTPRTPFSFAEAKEILRRNVRWAINLNFLYEKYCDSNTKYKGYFELIANRDYVCAGAFRYRTFSIPDILKGMAYLNFSKFEEQIYIGNV